MKKLKPEPREIDLYVSPKKPTEKELQEFAEFIREYKRKQAETAMFKEKKRKLKAA